MQKPFLVGLGLALLSLVWAAGLPSLAAQRTRLSARIELLNSKIKARNGRPDASGVVVWLEAPGLSARSNPPRQKMNQRGKRFLPHVMVVEKGTEIDFPNSDPFFHNVFSLFNGKRFDLGLYASGESRPVLFNRVGISYIFCNIHPLMSAIVVAVDTPYFTLSDANGQVTIPDVPEGRYQLKIWHERATPQELTPLARTVHIPASGNVDLGLIRINEAGYIPQPHPNKHGQQYDNERNKPAYKN
ncbi:MAG TPA: carboxypeptidase regulatory-like domain-containing protein [Blastocatellia bacterium]|nr:carboxypeptidase regulatory-like domain-containing protein [Blastocatellia bacterium]